MAKVKTREIGGPGTVGRTNATLPLTEPVEEAKEDEETDAEDDNFDIDDSSPEASSVETPHVEREQEVFDNDEREILKKSLVFSPAEAGTPGIEDKNLVFSPRGPEWESSKDDVRRRSVPPFGMNTSGRYAVPKNRSPRIGSSRRQSYASSGGESRSHSSGSTHAYSLVDLDRDGARDDMYSPRSAHSSGRSRIPKDRDVESEIPNLKTPTAGNNNINNNNDNTTRKRHGGSSEHPRAFAVWGQDESGTEMNSDSDNMSS